MALYKHWFVDFGPFHDGKFVESELGMIPEGWEVKNLESLLEIKYGKDHKKLDEGNIPVYGTGGIMRYVDKSLYEKDSILIPRKGSLGNVYYISEPFWTVDTLFYSKIKSNSYRKYLYYRIKNLDLASMDVGSAVPSLTTSLLKKLSIIVPPSELVEKFEKQVTQYFNLTNHNIKENQTLKSQRDTLLPKLVSGKVRIKGFE
jgi:type I restriction enzyme S subunit